METQQQHPRALFGELFKFSFETIKNNWVPFLLIVLLAIIPSVVMIVGGGTAVLTNIGALEAVNGSPDLLAIMPMMATLMTAVFASMVAGIIVGPVYTASNFYIAHNASQGVSVTAGDAIKFGFSKWINVFVAGLLLFLLSLLPLAAIGLLVAVVVGLAAFAGTTGAVLGGLIAFLASVAIMIVFGVKIAFVMPIVCVEEVGFGEALKMSMDLSSNGEFWDVLLKLILIILAVVGISLVAQFTIGLIPIVGAVVVMIISAVTDLLTNNYILAYYIDRKGEFFEKEPVSEPISF